jgi:protoporphyrinogen oxidase
MTRLAGNRKIAVIAGAGPAGLTAALELLRRSDILPIVFEADDQVGGISKTVCYRGNRMDLGGHRFFSKSDWVMRWWQEILPVDPGATLSTESLRIHYQGQSRELRPTSSAAISTSAAVPAQAGTPDPSGAADAVMLIRRRLSRIYYRRRFFDYPLKLNVSTLRNMGVLETLRIGLSYGQSKVLRRSPENSLEDFFINRFGSRLYRTFFKDYTEKVWGVACQEISAEWGAQRIKGLSVTKAVANALASPFRAADTAQRGTETSLIERFLYPKLGPGQMWEEVAKRVAAKGGEIHLRHRISGIELDGQKIVALSVHDQVTGTLRRVPADFFISTMPVRDLVAQLKPQDSRLIRIADRLPYRDFMTAGLLVRNMRRQPGSAASAPNGMPPDNWIYVQEPDVRVGRIQVFNNWSPALVADADTIWLGLEYFCREGDELWSMADGAFLDFAARELEQLGMLDPKDLIDGTVVRVPKAYPAYFGEYREFGAVREYLAEFVNLYPIGRNGMHRYNNQDHSMLAANGAVTAILNDGVGKAEIWNVNADEEYHEQIGEVA